MNAYADYSGYIKFKDSNELEVAVKELIRLKWLDKKEHLISDEDPKFFKNQKIVDRKNKKILIPEHSYYELHRMFMVFSDFKVEYNYVWASNDGAFSGCVVKKSKMILDCPDLYVWGNLYTYKKNPLSQKDMDNEEGAYDIMDDFMEVYGSMRLKKHEPHTAPFLVNQEPNSVAFISKIKK